MLLVSAAACHANRSWPRLMLWGRVWSYLNNRSSAWPTLWMHCRFSTIDIDIQNGRSIETDNSIKHWTDRPAMSTFRTKRSPKWFSPRAACIGMLHNLIGMNISLHAPRAVMLASQCRKKCNHTSADPNHCKSIYTYIECSINQCFVIIFLPVRDKTYSDIYYILHEETFLSTHLLVAPSVGRLNLLEAFSSVVCLAWGSKSLAISTCFHCISMSDDVFGTVPCGCKINIWLTRYLRISQRYLELDMCWTSSNPSVKNMCLGVIANESVGADFTFSL